MEPRSPGVLARVATAAVAAVAAVTAGIALPASVITLHGFLTGDAGEITTFARTVAEPLALIGSAAATYGIARYAVRRRGAGVQIVPWIGGAAAAGVIAAALWVADVDMWTAVAAVSLPAAALAGGRKARPAVADDPARLGAPVPGPVSAAREERQRQGA